MCKISINLCVVRPSNLSFLDSEKAELDPQTTKNCCAACMVTLDKLAGLGRFIEVVRVSFVQKQANRLTAEFIVVIIDPFGGPKFEIRADFPYDSIHVFSEETISYTLCHKVREKIREKFSQAEGTVMQIKEDIDKP